MGMPTADVVTVAVGGARRVALRTVEVRVRDTMPVGGRWDDVLPVAHKHACARLAEAGLAADVELHVREKPMVAGLPPVAGLTSRYDVRVTIENVRAVGS